MMRTSPYKTTKNQRDRAMAYYYKVRATNPNYGRVKAAAVRASVARRKLEDPAYAIQLREADRDKHLRRTYGITAVQWDALFESQGRCCAICGSDSPRRKQGWCTDHKHGIFGVRAILCHQCNLLLGNCEDDPERLRAAIVYLERHS